MSPRLRRPFAPLARIVTPRPPPRGGRISHREREELVRRRIRRSDRGQLDRLHARLVKATPVQRCGREGCCRLTRKTPLCEEHLAEFGLRVGPSTVCRGDGLFAVASQKARDEAKAEGKAEKDVVVFDPEVNIYITDYDGAIMQNPTMYELEQLELTAHWMYTFKIDSSTYIDASLLNFTGRFINCAYPNPTRANARFSSNSRDKRVIIRATQLIRHGQEILVSSYGSGYFPRFLGKLEEGTLCAYATRELVPRSRREERFRQRKFCIILADREEGAGVADAPQPVRIGWWENRPALRPAPKRRPSSSKKRKATGGGGRRKRQRREEDEGAEEGAEPGAAAGAAAPPIALYTPGGGYWAAAGGAATYGKPVYECRTLLAEAACGGDAAAGAAAAVEATAGVGGALLGPHFPRPGRGHWGAAGGAATYGKPVLECRVLSPAAYAFRE